MSRDEREAWADDLDADPAFRAAWDAFKAQLARDSLSIQQGVQPTGQGLREAARAVYVAAGLDPDQADAFDDE
jgi:hypothetical protein